MPWHKHFARTFGFLDEVVLPYGEIVTRRNWLMTGPKLRIIATAAIRLYMAPACPCCKGRGFTGVETISEEGMKDCPDCKGAGYIYRLQPGNPGCAGGDGIEAQGCGCGRAETDGRESGD